MKCITPVTLGIALSMSIPVMAQMAGQAGMTMTFRAADPKMLDSVKEGDKIKFTADKTGNDYFVTGIEKK